jgi:DNA-binding MarR family transcriptional regulator
MSRHLRDIGPTNRHQEPGFGLVEMTFEPKDMRRHIYVLTPKGRLLARELREILEGATNLGRGQLMTMEGLNMTEPPARRRLVEYLDDTSEVRTELLPTPAPALH